MGIFCLHLKQSAIPRMIWLSHLILGHFLYLTSSISFELNSPIICSGMVITTEMRITIVKLIIIFEVDPLKPLNTLTINARIIKTIPNFLKLIIHPICSDIFNIITNKIKVYQNN